MSQELLICENNIIQLSHFHIQDIKDSMSLFYYLYLWTFHSDYLMYHLSFYSHCSNSYIYTFGNYWNNYSYFLGKKTNHRNFNKKPSIIVKFWSFWHYFIHFWQAFNLPTSIDQYLCTHVNRQSLIPRPASAQSPSSKANTVHIRLVRNISVNSWDCCYRWDSSNKFRTLHQLAFPSLESHFAGP